MRESLPLRGLAIGALVGAVGAISNVFVSLKAGWSLPVMTTAAVVGLGIARAQRNAFGAREAVVATSLASATAFMTGGGNMAAVPATAMLGFATPSPAALIAWFAVTAAAGTLLAPLLARAVHNLRFPTATATATLLMESNTAGIHDPAENQANSNSGNNNGSGAPASGTASAPRSALWIATAAGAGFAALRRIAGVPATLAGPYTFGLDTSALLAGVGALMMWTTAWSTVVGGLLTYGVIAPRLVASGLVEADASYRSLVSIMVWPAASLLVASSLTELALDARKLLRRTEAATPRPRLVGLVLVVAVAVLLGREAFHLAWPVLLASVPIAVVFAYVAARSMGETDAVPTRALAPLAQATVALVGDGVAGPLLAPNLTGAAAIHAADTLGSLKLAATLDVPTALALRVRLAGNVLGAIVVVLTLRIVAPDLRALPTAELPAPAVLVWKSVAEVVGTGHLPSTMHLPIALGALAGVALAALARNERLAPYVPSPMGIGSGMVLPASTALSIFIGAVGRRVLSPRHGLAVTMAIASGVIAGESIVGLALQLLR